LGLIKEWLGLYFIDLHQWPTKTLKEWWLLIIGPSSTNHKAISSVVLLTSLEIWNEINARVFRNKEMPTSVILSNIKKELSFWVAGAGGAKRVSVLMPGE
jgi:hypothetical protein